MHPNPGPESLSTSVSFTISDCSLLASHNLSIIHLNIQSLLPKISIVEVETQSYDILIFTESWLSPRISHDDICIPNFDPPYRKYRLGRQGGGVAIYTRIGIPSVERQDLLYYDLEAICVEIILKSHKYLVCGVYRLPDTGHEYWDLIEQTFDNMSTSSIDDLVIFGDFNCNMLDDNSFNKMRQIACSYNLHQLINEPTNYTEHSSSLIDLILVSKPNNVLYSDVTSTFIPDPVRYHCPTVLFLKYRKPPNQAYKRHIRLYDKGDYVKYRQLLADVDWNQVMSSGDLYIVVKAVTDTIINSAKAFIPNKTVTIRPNEPKMDKQLYQKTN